MGEEPLPNGETNRITRSSVLRIVVILVCLSIASILFIRWFTNNQGPSPIPADALSKIEQEKGKAQREYQDFLHTAAGKIWEKHPDWDREVCAKVAAGEVIPGMSKGQAAEALARRSGGTIKRRTIGAEEEWAVDSQGIVLRFSGNVLKTVQRR